PDARRPRQRLVGPLVERLERRVLERAPGRPVRRVEARAPVHAVGIEGPAEVEEDDLGGASDAGGPRASAPAAAWAWSPPFAARARHPAACSGGSPADIASPSGPPRATRRHGRARTARPRLPSRRPGPPGRWDCRNNRSRGNDDPARV